MDSVSISVTIVSDLRFALEGSDEAGTIQIRRSYAEFTALRTLLLHRWPGFVIPHLLTKPLSVPLEHLRHLLELFLQGLGSLSVVYSASETQLFLRSPRDYLEIAEQLTCDVRSIGLTYETVLSEYFQQPFSQALLTEVSEYRNYLQQVAKELERTKQKVTVVNKAHQRFEQEYLKFLGMVEAFKRNQDSEMPEYIPVNEYAMVMQWIEAELHDARAVIDALCRVGKLDERRCKLLIKQEKEQVAIASLTDDRRSIRQIFGRAPKKAADQRLELMRQTVEEIRQHSQVLNVAVRLLHTQEVPRFKARKKARYQAMLASFSDFSVKYFRSLIEMLQFKFNQFLP